MAEKALIYEIEDLKQELAFCMKEMRDLRDENLRLQYMIHAPAGKENEKEHLRIGVNEIPDDKDALKTENETLKAVIDNLAVGIGITDNNGNILSLNQAAMKIHGFRSEAEMFSSFSKYKEEFDLQYPDGRHMPVEEWPTSRAVHGDYVRDFEANLIRKQAKSRRTVNYTAVPIKDDAGTLMLIVFSMTDITETSTHRGVPSRFRYLFS
jgi:PAS domain S-box-containing protein